MKTFYELKDYYQNKEILCLVVHLNNKQIPKIVDFSKLRGPNINMINPTHINTDRIQIYCLKHNAM